MKEGQILAYFINNQKKLKKKQIADDLGMSRNLLYEYCNSRTLNEEIKEKFEQYFNAEIFSGENVIRAMNDWREAAQHHEPSDIIISSKEEWDARIQECEHLRQQNHALSEHNKYLRERMEELKLLVANQPVTKE